MNNDLRRRHEIRNTIHTAVLTVAMAALVAFCAWAVWGLQGVVWAFAGLVIALVFSRSVSPDMLARMYRAQLLTPDQFPDGYAVMGELSKRAGLDPAPKLFYVQSQTLNAFTVGGRKNPCIMLTDGILRTLNARELIGVLAHELSHIRSNDLKIMALADIFSRITSLFSYFGFLLLIFNVPLAATGSATVPWIVILVLILAPTIMDFLQLGLSRTREYDADMDAAHLTGDPVGLASALDKLERYQGQFWEHIVYPTRRMPEPSLLRTHPPTEERIRRLLELKQATPDSQLPPMTPALPRGLGIVAKRPQYHWSGAWY